MDDMDTEMMSPEDLELYQAMLTAKREKKAAKKAAQVALITLPSPDDLQIDLNTHATLAYADAMKTVSNALTVAVQARAIESMAGAVAATAEAVAMAAQDDMQVIFHGGSMKQSAMLMDIDDDMGQKKNKKEKKEKKEKKDKKEKKEKLEMSDDSIDELLKKDISTNSFTASMAVDDDLELDLSKKKKKKKTYELDQDAIDLGLDLDFTVAKKKKKRDKVIVEEEEEKTVTAEIVGDGIDEVMPTYDEMLDRLYEQIHASNPQHFERTNKKLKAPTVQRVGTTRTSWSNFADCCKSMTRDQDHVQLFVLSELGATGSIDGDNNFIIKGKYLSKIIENLMRKYLDEYVRCTTCRSLETALTRDAISRLHFVKCKSCQSSRSVLPIKAGYHATTKADRKAERED
jgi:translation initiation factor 2 subunit 2